jgi:antitoxin FitA
MPNVLVRNIPPDVHAALQRNAELQGKSLQQYLAAELTRLANKPTLDEVLDRIERRRGGKIGFAEAVATLDEVRAERDRR